MTWCCTVAEAQERCTVSEFKLWQAYAAIDPWGDVRADYHAASVALTVAQSNGMKMDGRKPQLADFLIRFGVKARQTTSQMMTFFRGWSAAHNARVARHGNDDRQSGSYPKP